MVYLSLLLFIAAFVALYLLVPREKIAEYFGFGLVAGPVLGLILLYVMISVLGVWTFSNIDILYIAGIPVFQALTWLPLEIGFAYYFLRSRTSLTYLTVILALPVLATLSHYVYLQLGLLEYSNWYLFSTFLVSLLIHLGLAAYLYYVIQQRNRLA